MVFNSVGHFGWSERRSGEGRKAVEKVVERVSLLVGLVDMVDSIVFGISSATDRKFRAVGEIDEDFVAMVWREVEVGQEVGPQYRLADISDDE